MTQPLHILVVENSMSDRELLRKRLDDLGVDCTTCDSGYSAAATLKRLDFDGVILDGQASTDETFLDCADHDRRHIPMILFSGDNDGRQLRKMWDDGYFVVTKDQVSRKEGPLGDFIKLILRKQTRG